ncbi:Zn-dependent exopeptidase, partial [Conidiobolus coronatus NRRL 28638]
YDSFKLASPSGKGIIKVLSNNVQELADRTFQQPNYKKGQDWFDNYHTYEDIKKWYINHSKKDPSHVKFVASIGKTDQSNDIFAVHLTNNNTLPYGRSKSKIWFQSLIHAREWLGGSTTHNSDGYKYTQIERYWRKNRKSPHGVDINRNFPYKWGGPGASEDPYEIDYRGPSAGSELETKAITSYFKEQGHIAGAIDFHTFSELVLRPPGDKGDTPDEAKLKKLGDEIRDVIVKSRGTLYTSQKSYELYSTSGTAMDWFYGEGNTYGYTIELSPKYGGEEGFSPPPIFIKPVGAELYPAAVHFINQKGKLLPFKPI